MRAANSPARAASSCPCDTWRAASALDAAGRQAACGRFCSSHRRHWAWACGWPPTVVTSPSSVPGRVSSANATGSGTSALITRSRPVASSSRVAVTAPSTEFSMGTMPRSADPLRTAASVAWMVTQGIAWPAAPGSKASSAASVKVPSGPRYAYCTGLSAGGPGSAGSLGWVRDSAITPPSLEGRSRGRASRSSRAAPANGRPVTVRENTSGPGGARPPPVRARPTAAGRRHIT